jgi:hypothetical protein
MACSSSGPAYLPAGTMGKGGPYSQPSGNAIPSGLFQGWQYWQATVAIQVGICIVALLVSAILLPPVRRLPWRRQPRGRGTGLIT